MFFSSLTEFHLLMYILASLHKEPTITRDWWWATWKHLPRTATGTTFTNATLCFTVQKRSLYQVVASTFLRSESPRKGQHTGEVCIMARWMNIPGFFFFFLKKWVLCALDRRRKEVSRSLSAACPKSCVTILGLCCLQSMWWQHRCRKIQ